MVTIEEIKQLCRLAIELGEKATPGPWQAGGVCNLEVRQPRGRMIADCGPHHTPLNEYPVGCANQDRANAAFIAQARTICPAAARSTLAAIKYADRLDSVHESRELLEEIRTAWEGRK